MSQYSVHNTQYFFPPPTQYPLFFSVYLLTLKYKVLYMNEKHDPLNDLKEIRQMMESSSRFISLSGLSGVLAGIYALIGVGLIVYLDLYHSSGWFYKPSIHIGKNLDHFLNFYYNIGAYALYTLDTKVFLIGFIVFVLAISTSLYFTYKKIRKDNINLWSPVTKKLFINLTIPLIVGGWFSAILLLYGIDFLITAVCLIFYGMALMNASKYTLPDIWYLGLVQIILGMINMIAPGYGLILWAIGFGFGHIIYGLIMYNKYERK
jgi:hypothetical protein